MAKFFNGLQALAQEYQPYVLIIAAIMIIGYRDFLCTTARNKKCHE